MWAPGSTGQLSLFIGDRAHIPMYIALSRHSTCAVLVYQIIQPGGTNTVQHRGYSPVVAVPSHFRQVAQTDGTQGAQYRVYQCYAIDGAHRGALVEGNSLQHSALQPAPWWDQSVTGGTNPGPREPTCPGQAKAQNSTKVKPNLRSCLQ